MSGELFQLLQFMLRRHLKTFLFVFAKEPPIPLTPEIKVKYTTVAAKESAKNVIELISFYSLNIFITFHMKEKKKVHAEVHWFFLLLLFSWHFTRLERILRKRIKRRNEHLYSALRTYFREGGMVVSSNQHGFNSVLRMNMEATRTLPIKVSFVIGLQSFLLSNVTKSLQDFWN